MTLTSKVQGLAQTVSYHEATTGSKGFFATSKIADGDSLYQGQVSAWLVGSKADKTLKVGATHEQARDALSGFVATSLQPKEFRSGKRGFYGQGKVAIEGQIFQVAAQAVKVR